MRIVPLLLVACGTPEPPGQVPTGRIEPVVTLEAVGDGELDVAVVLTAGGEPYALEGEDELVAILGGNVFTLIFDRFEEIVTYRTTFFEAPVDQDVTISLNRTEEEDATRTLASLPAELEITVPSSASRAEDLVVTWAPADEPEPIEITVSGDCVDTYTATVDDTGAHTVPAGALGGSGSCAADVYVSRVRQGMLDDAFGGGSIEARQRRIATIDVGP